MTIVIPTFNRKDLLIELLLSIQQQTLKDYEVFIIDNGPSTDGTEEYCRKLEQGDQRFHYSGIGPNGCVASRNIGFIKGSSPIFVTFDDDVELVDTSTLSHIHKCFSRDERLGVLGISEYYPHTRDEIKTIKNDALSGWFRIFRNTTMYYPGRINKWGYIGTKFHHLPFGQLHEVDHVRSSSMAIRREAFQQAGGFDERYSAQGLGYRYETDLCVRINHFGYKVAYSACEPQVYHKVGERVRGWNRQGFDKSYLLYTNRNNTYFFLSNYWGRSTAIIFMIWDILVGNSTQPGIVRWLVFEHGFFLPKILSSVKGKLWGWKMFWEQAGAK